MYSVTLASSKDWDVS